MGILIAVKQEYKLKLLQKWKMGKGENASRQIFLLLPGCVQSFPKQISVFLS